MSTPAADDPAAPANPPSFPLRARRCPRCGYDLLGAIALWHDRCELRGECTECGLRFEWAELLSPRMRTPRWCVEHGRGRRVLVRALATCVMAWLPWWFWGSLRMSHPIRWRRLLGYAAALLIITWLGFLVSHGTIAWHSWHNAVTFWSTQGRVPPPPNLPSSAPAAVLEYTLLPWRRQPPPALYWGYPYVEPRELFLQNWKMMAFFAPPVLLFFAICPLTFLLLPTSLRRAKVRRAHLARIGLYALSMPVAAALLLMLHRSAETATAAWPFTGLSPSIGFSAVAAISDVAALLGRTAAALLPVLPFLWWSFAASRYLRLPHAWVVGISLTTIAVLLTALLMALTILLTGIQPPWWR